VLIANPVLMVSVADLGENPALRAVPMKRQPGLSVWRTP
jgi:hypothetical protein